MWDLEGEVGGVASGEDTPGECTLDKLHQGLEFDRRHVTYEYVHRVGASDHISQTLHGADTRETTLSKDANAGTQHPGLTHANDRSNKTYLAKWEFRQLVDDPSIKTTYILLARCDLAVLTHECYRLDMM